MTITLEIRTLKIKGWSRFQWYNPVAHEMHMGFCSVCKSSFSLEYLRGRLTSQDTTAVRNLPGNTGSDLQIQSEYFRPVSDSWPQVKCGKPRPPGSPLGKNKHWKLFANVIWLWSTQQLFWVYAIHKYMSTWGRFTASELGARLAWEWESDWLSMC